MQPGGVWSGDYLVLDMEDASALNLDKRRIERIGEITAPDFSEYAPIHFKAEYERQRVEGPPLEVPTNVGFHFWIYYD